MQCPNGAPGARCPVFIKWLGKGLMQNCSVLFIISDHLNRIIALVTNSIEIGMSFDSSTQSKTHVIKVDQKLRTAPPLLNQHIDSP